MNSNWIAVVGLAVSLGAFGCSGPQGSQGAPGPAGETGPIGPPANADGRLPASCLSPCHGFNGIVEQWRTSTHFAAFVANLNGTEVPVWTGPLPCGNCHARDALERRVTGSVGTAADAGVPNVTSGELGYRTSSGALNDSTYTGSSKVASVHCVTCHMVTDANDPHRTGLAYTPGAFPLRVPSGASDQAYIEKSPDTSAVTGSPAGKLAAANTCVWCHKSRKDVTNYIVASNKLTSTHWGPHEGPQADVFTGTGGYHFTGKTYGTSTHQQKLNCVDCHMPTLASNSNARNHSFYAQLSACQQCHTGATSFDIAGGQSQVKALLFELEKLLSDVGYITRSGSAPYLPLSATELADGNFKLDLTLPGPTLTANQAGALYNYIIVARGGAIGVHNPKYVRQILYDSYFAIKGLPPTTMPIRP